MKKIVMKIFDWFFTPKVPAGFDESIFENTTPGVYIPYGRNVTSFFREISPVKITTFEPVMIYLCKDIDGKLSWSSDTPELLNSIQPGEIKECLMFIKEVKK